MSTDDLRDQLARLADSAPHVVVRQQTWGRARRARRRDLLTSTTAAIAAVAVLAGAIGLWFPRGYDTPVADSGGAGIPALPDRLHDVPSHVADDRATTDLAIGRGAVAWLTDPDVAVVVDATDGDYHLLRLPELADGLAQVSASMTGSGALLALSPDGHRLAYARRGGVGVVDLVSGEVDSVTPPGERVVVDRLAWSSAGDYLAWEGSRVERTDDGFSSYAGSTVGGVIDPTEATSTAVEVPGAPHALSITDDGRYLPIIDTNVGYVSDEELRRGVYLQRWPISSTAVVDADGRILVGVGSAQAVTTASTIDPAAVATVSYLDDAGRSEVYLARRGDFDTTALGWSPDGLGLVTVMPDGRHPTVLLVDETGDRTVTTAEEGVPADLSIATDLVTADRPSVERPDPGFPGSGRPWWILLTAGIFLGLLALGAAVRLGPFGPTSTGGVGDRWGSPTQLG